MKSKKIEPRWGRIITALILFVLLLILITRLNVKEDSKEKTNKQVTEQQETKEVLPTNTTIEKKYIPYRLTSYYTGDNTGSGEWVGAGIHTSQFEINEKGWYTYKGKLVLASATNECLNSTSGACNKWNIPKVDKHYYNYYDEVKVIIDEVEYEGIILDSCGACMDLNENRIDLFVSNKESVIDRGYRGVNSILVKLKEVSK